MPPPRSVYDPRAQRTAESETCRQPCGRPQAGATNGIPGASAGTTLLKTSHGPRAVVHERRDDIEGLRALAVVLVVLFHADLLGVTGGFVGVDVFFVISGFLITGLLIRERRSTGSISLRNFYARRARRLLPASALVLVVTLAAAAIMAPPLLVPQIAHDVTAAALYVSNVSFAAQATDYFAAGAAPSPVLHFWSLGVEEQFYLLWPALILVITRGARNPARRIGLAVTLIAVASLGFASWLAGVSLPWAFFLLPSRAWELALGGMLAVLEPQLGRIPGQLAAGGAWLGLGLVVAAGFLLTGASAFPGMAALLPTTGAVLLIAGGMAAAPWGPARLLGARLPRFIGGISYSVYLWHWPLLVLPALALGAPLPVWSRLVLALAAFPLAAATARLVEDPLRHGRFIGTRPRWNLAMAGALAVAVVLTATSVSASVGAELGSTAPAASADADQNAQSLDQILDAVGSPNGSPGASVSASPASPAASPTLVANPSTAGMTPMPDRTPIPTPQGIAAPVRPQTANAAVPSNLQPSLAAAASDMPLTYQDGCHTGMDLPPSTASCLYANLSSSHTIALFGDSHALSWFPAVYRLAMDKGWRVLSLTMSACSPADVIEWNPAWNRTMPNCELWREQSVAELVRAHPDIVLVTGTRGFENVDASGNVVTGDLRTRFWIQGMKRTLARLVPAAGRVILIGDLPISVTDPPVCLSKHLNDTLACDTPVDQAINYDWINTEFTVARAMGTGYIDPERWICVTSPCPAVIGNLLVMRDNGHMTATFAAALWRRLEAAVVLAASQATTTLIW